MGLEDAFGKAPEAEAPTLIVPVLGKRPRESEPKPDTVTDGSAAAPERDPNKKTRRETKADKFKYGKEREDEERLARTLFVGNVPLKVNAKTLARMFQRVVDEKLHKDEKPVSLPSVPASDEKPAAITEEPKADDDSDDGEAAAAVAGETEKEKEKRQRKRMPRDIESVRFRSVAIAGLAVAPGSDFKAMRKAGFIKRNFDSEKRDTMNAYVVFKSVETARAGLSLNAALCEGKHLRVDSCDPALGGGGRYDHKRTVFVGNLERKTSDEELRGFFAGVVSGGGASVEGVRIVRDKASNEAKGIAYVLFAERTHVAEALGAAGNELRGRKLRLSRCTADGEAPGRKAGADAGGSAKRNKFQGSVGASRVKLDPSEVEKKPAAGANNTVWGAGGKPLQEPSAGAGAGGGKGKKERAPKPKHAQRKARAAEEAARKEGGGAPAAAVPAATAQAAAKPAPAPAAKPTGAPAAKPQQPTQGGKPIGAPASKPASAPAKPAGAPISKPFSKPATAPAPGGKPSAHAAKPAAPAAPTIAAAAADAPAAKKNRQHRKKKAAPGAGAE